MSEAFSRCMRLARGRDYERVFEHGHRARDEVLTVLALDNGRSVPRLGLAIGVRHARRASRRNRIKRIVRESFRRHQALLTGLDIVVLGRPGLDAVGEERLRASLERHWQRLRGRRPAVQAPGRPG